MGNSVKLDDIKASTNRAAVRAAQADERMFQIMVNNGNPKEDEGLNAALASASGAIKDAERMIRQYQP